MFKRAALLLALIPAAAPAQKIASGRWAVTSTAVDLDIPGAPAFLVRMMTGKSRSERKCVTPEQARQGVAALLVPDPKARCRVDGVRIADGRYAQTLTCPQRRGEPLRISREGRYDAAGFTGRLTMTGQTRTGALHVTLDQKAAHLAGACRG